MSSSLLLRAYLLLAASLALLLCAISVGVLKLLPLSDAWLLRALQEDDYYCLLVPLLLPVAILFVYINWIGYKLYRHN